MHYGTGDRSSQSPLDVIVLWRSLWDGRWLIVGGALLGAVAGVVVALTSAAWYRSEVVLLPVESKASQGLSGRLAGLSGIASLAGISVGGSGNPEPIAILKSRDFARRFISEQKLEELLISKGLGGSETGGKSLDIRDALDFFDREVRSVIDDRKSGLITLAIEWKDPEASANWANAMAALLNEDVRQRALEDAQSSIDYLRTQLAAAEAVSLQQAIGRLLESELEKSMLARGSEEFVFRIIDAADVPKNMVRPKRQLIVAASLFVGLMLGVFAALIKSRVLELLGRKRT